MKTREVMTSVAISIPADATVAQAADLMLRHRISGLPVVDAKGALVGIVTEGDFLRRGELGTLRKRLRWLAFWVGPGTLATEYVQAHGRKVSEIMTPSPHTVAPDSRLRTSCRSWSAIASNVFPSWKVTI